MDNASIINAYKRYARSYDCLFGRILDPGRRLVVEKMNCLPGEKVLEVGVGTGLSLPCYPDRTSVVGIDISPHMLARANQRIFSEGLRNCSLRLMNAQNMSFVDGFFDKVAAMYIASVVPNPQDMVSEMKRVCKPGGDLLIDMPDQDGYFIDQNKKGKELLAYIRREVKISGTMMREDEGGDLVFKVKEYSLIT